MRIISGTLKGRRIQPPANMPFTRPTTDVAKEGLFNILNSNLDYSSATTLDLFGGTGCISYELFSRGASELHIVEKDAKMYKFIERNIRELEIKNCFLYNTDVFRFLHSCTKQFNFIFAGPPYALPNIEEIGELIFEKNILATDGIFVLEHTTQNNFSTYKNFKLARNYGTTIFSFFKNV